MRWLAQPYDTDTSHIYGLKNFAFLQGVIIGLLMSKRLKTYGPYHKFKTVEAFTLIFAVFLARMPKAYTVGLGQHSIFIM